MDKTHGASKTGANARRTGRRTKATTETTRIRIGDRDVHLVLELDGAPSISREALEKIEEAMWNGFNDYVSAVLAELHIAETVVQLVAK